MNTHKNDFRGFINVYAQQGDNLMQKFKFRRKQIATCLVATALLIGQSSFTAMAAGKKGSVSNKDHKLTKAERKAKRKANRLSKKLRKMAKQGKHKLVDVIVKYKDMPNAISNDKARAHGGKVKKSFNKFAMRSFKIPANQLEAFSEANDIEFISVDSPVQGFSMSSKNTAKLPKKGSSNYVMPASNIAVAVLDSGVEKGTDLNLAMQVNIIGSASSALFRNEFNTNAVSNNDGTHAWNSDW